MWPLKPVTEIVLSPLYLTSASTNKDFSMVAFQFWRSPEWMEVVCFNWLANPNQISLSLQDG